MTLRNRPPLAILSVLATAMAGFVLTFTLIFVSDGGGAIEQQLPPLVDRVQGSFEFKVRSAEARESDPQFSALQAETKARSVAESYVEDVKQAGPAAEDIPGTGFVLRESQFAANTLVVRHELFESGHNRPMDVWVFVFDRADSGRAIEGAPTMIVELEDGTGAVVSAALISNVPAVPRPQ